jgi:hypothetical protein
MSVKGFYRDIILLSVMVSLIIGSIITFYYYFTTHDETSLYMGLVFIFVIVFGAIARYRFLIDYVGTLFKRWR